MNSGQMLRTTAGLAVRCIGGVALLVGLLAVPALARTAAAAECEIKLGFAALREQIEEMENRDVVGECLENEHQAGNGYTVQRTAGGVLIWRQADNWTGFTDHSWTWVAGKGGLHKVSYDEQFPWEIKEALGFAPGIPYLLVIDAPSGALVPQPGAPGNYALTLTNPSPTVTWFIDRPQRLAGHRSLETFLALWDMFGFPEVPPRAAIALRGGDLGADTLLVALANPSRSGTALVFQASVLPPGTVPSQLAFHGRRADEALPPSFGPVSLFVDSAGSRCKIGPLGSCPNANLLGAALQGVNLNRADLSNADLRGADLRDSDLLGTNLSGANLLGANLSRAALSGANLLGATLSGAAASGAAASGAFGYQADLSFADLSEADLRMADLRFTNLLGANLLRADLRDADLRSADLRGADLRFARLGEAKLNAADLFEANLRGAQLEGARFCRTTMPDGTQRNDHC